MANDNKNMNELVSDRDDDPTAELEILSEAIQAEIDACEDVETESEANTFDFAKLQAEFGDADETISSLKSDLKSRTENISKLQFDIEQLRARWSGLEKEIKVREELTENLTEELKLASTKQTRSDRLLGKSKAEIKSLKSQLSGKEQSLLEFSRAIEETRNAGMESESRVSELMAQLNAAEKSVVALTNEVQFEHAEKQEAIEQTRLLSVQARRLGDQLAVSRESLAELQHYIDQRKLAWDRQIARLDENDSSIKRLSKELEIANAELLKAGVANDQLNAMLMSANSDRDELLNEITQLRKNAQDEDSERASEDKKLIAEQAATLTAKDFQINELQSQITRTEIYADGLRRQIQEQLSHSDELETRRKYLETSLTSTNARVEELSECIDDLRSRNEGLVLSGSRLQEEFEREMQQIRFELGEARKAIADREELNEQLSSDLVNTGKFTMSLETRISEADKQSKATIEMLNKKLTSAESLNEELTRKLDGKDEAITALLKEVAKRSKAIESIGEIEDVIHELDDRMSDRIDEGTSTERERLTRLLIGKVGSQKLRFPLFKDRLTIGRTGHNDIQLNAPYVSRRHAVILTDDKGTTIVDWGSKNGVFVNSERVTEQILRNGDIVKIGTADFTFEERAKR